MLYDHRTYTCRPGTIRKQLGLYGEHGFPVQLRHIGRPLLHSVTEIGDVNSYVHIWVYEDMADREQKRAAMKADPAWGAYLKLSAEAGYLIKQVNKILVDSPIMAGLDR